MTRAGVVLAACLALVACNGGDNESATDVIEVFGPYLTVEADNFAASLQEFEDQTGLTVRYTGSADFVQDLRQRVASGVSSPDIAIVPQPGVVDELVEAELLVALDDASVQTLMENHPPALIDEESVSGAIFGAPFRESIKSLVWYRPSVFEENGWSVPTTLDELEALVDDIATPGDDGTTMSPWCFTMEAGSATGWAATDWVEDLMLRFGGPDAYDEWAAGERGFDDETVRDAFRTFDDLIVRQGRTAGGLRNILQTEVSRGSEPLFASEPGCAMYKQASFAESWFPDGTTIGDDVDFFVLPGTDAAVPGPLVVGGDTLVQFSDDPDVHRLMNFLISPAGPREWASRGGFFNGLTTVGLDTYYSAADRRFAELLREDRIVRFDASDVMPAAIGSSLFWSEITEWVAGVITLDELAATMDAAYADADTE